MLRFNRCKGSRGFSSLMAMYCSVILLNLAMGYFAVQRSNLRLHGADIVALKRKSFQTSILFVSWAESVDHLEDGQTSWQMTWDDEPCSVDYFVDGYKHFTVEKIFVTALNHPEWGTMRSTRIGADPHVLFIQGRALPE